MFRNLKYHFENRTTKKSLKKDIKDLEKEVSKLYKEMGRGREGWITFGVFGTPLEKDESLQAQLNELRDYLGIDYAEKKLGPKPKEEKK